MRLIYLDNAATTPIHGAVIESMMPYISEHYGNPSSIHSLGRTTRLAIENVRKVIAKQLYVAPSEIFFTSGATEATNAIILNAINTLECNRIITTCTEHHATLHSIDRYAHEYGIDISYIGVDTRGNIDLNELDETLARYTHQRPLVCLMHANNEIATITDIKSVGNLCVKYNAIFFSDTVQSICHYEIDFKDCNLDFAVGTAHKFHGPKGIGFIYINSKNKIKPLLEGGAQERNMRAGTENVSGIVGMGKAFEIAYQNLNHDSQYISGLKSYCIQEMCAISSEIGINGDADGLYTIANFSFPRNSKTDFLEINLDIAGICVSGGSACSSGSAISSHVIAALPIDSSNVIPLRVSFSKYNTKDEIDILIREVKRLLY